MRPGSRRFRTISPTRPPMATNGWRPIFIRWLFPRPAAHIPRVGVRSTTQRLIERTRRACRDRQTRQISRCGATGFCPWPAIAEINTGNGQSQMLACHDRIVPNRFKRLLCAAKRASFCSAGPLCRMAPSRPTRVIRSDGLKPVQINVNQFTGEPTTKIDLGVNLPATSKRKPGASMARPRSCLIEYYDNMGTSESVSISFSPDCALQQASPTNGR